MNKNYNPFKTAIKRKKLSKPMSILYNNGLLKGKILDYGTGHGVDCDVLSLEPTVCNIIGYDKYSPQYNDNKEVLNETYDVITCNYVFNVIPNLEEHRAVLDTILSICKEAYIAVRTDVKAINDSWLYDDEHRGYWTTTGTFQRFYNDSEMINEMFGEVEYIVNDGSMKLFKITGKKQ